ncbi:MAG TPA: DinB family protein [Chthonomonadaceae bacterium]|nr:DinB family protein [Chthonomonadaceae bacterium]
MMTVFDYQARIIERTAASLAYWLQMTAPDRVNWKPTVEGSAPTRSAIEQIQECIRVNRTFAAKLSGHEPDHGNAPAELTSEEAQQQLISSAKELAAVVRGLDEDSLSRDYTLSWGTLPGLILIELAVANMSYHGGQINLIQLLYGDEKFHVNPDFFNM